MLCKVSDKAFDDKEWAFEIKWDGYRAIADLSNDDIRLYSRNGIDFSQKFKKVTNSLKLQEHNMVLDGEIVATMTKENLISNGCSRLAIILTSH